MKRTLTIWLLCTLPLAAFAPADTGSDIPESRAAFIQDICLSNIRKYYSYVEDLLGNNINDSQKTVIAREVEQRLFFDPQTRIRDLNAFARSDYDVPTYFANVATLYNKLAVQIALDTGMQLSKIYFKPDEQYYFIVTTVTRAVQVNSNNGDTPPQDRKTVDIYQRFQPGDARLLIYSIQDHRENALTSLTATRIVPDRTASGSTDKHKSYFAFNITPASATVRLDGQAVFNDGDKVETAPGTHTIEVTERGYHTETFTVTTNQNSVQPVKLSLVRQMGYLAINSGNSALNNAAVYIDDSLAGNLPLKNIQLATGSHTISIKTDRHRKNYTVTILDQRVTMLQLQKSTDSWRQYAQDVFAMSYPNLFVSYAPIHANLFAGGHFERLAISPQRFIRERIVSGFFQKGNHLFKQLMDPKLLPGPLNGKNGILNSILDNPLLKNHPLLSPGGPLPGLPLPKIRIRR